MAGFLQPDFTSRWTDIQRGLIESLTMTLTSTVVGVAISVPIGIGTARNLAPRWISMICRGIEAGLGQTVIERQSGRDAFQARVAGGANDRPGVVPKPDSLR